MDSLFLVVQDFDFTFFCSHVLFSVFIFKRDFTEIGSFVKIFLFVIFPSPPQMVKWSRNILFHVMIIVVVPYDKINFFVAHTFMHTKFDSYNHAYRCALNFIISTHR